MNAALAFLESKYKRKRLNYLVMMGMCVGLIALQGRYGLFSIMVGVDDPRPSHWPCKTAKCLAEGQASTAWSSAREKFVLAVFLLTSTLVLLVLWWPVRSRSSPAPVRLVLERAGDVV